MLTPLPFAVLALLVLQAARYWCIRSLGPYWNTKVMILPGASLHRRGPYKWFRHPNYLVVIIDATNLQSGTDYFDRTIEPYVVDDPWSDTYFQSSAGTTYSKWQFGGLASTLTYVNPGDFVRIVMAFDVPDSEGHLLLSTDIPKWVDLGDFAAMPIEE